MSPVDVSVIVVTYKAWDRVRPCLESVFRECAGLSSEVIVVDNASGDGTPEHIRSEFPQAQLIVNESNKGFAAANNQGIRLSHGRYVLLLNPDTVIHDRTVAAVAGFLDATPSAWVAGCRLNSADGSVQTSVGAFPSVLEGFLKSFFLYLLFPREAVIHSRGIRRFDYTSPAPVDWVMGAFFMIRREALDALGLLDEQFFMYTEEVDFCKRVWECGRQVWYTPSGVVTHYWAGQNAVSGRTLLWLNASQILYVRKYHSGPGRIVMIFLKYVALALRALAYALFGCLTLNRKLLAKSTYAVSAIYRLLSTPIPGIWGTG